MFWTPLPIILRPKVLVISSVDGKVPLNSSNSKEEDKDWVPHCDVSLMEASRIKSLIKCDIYLFINLLWHNQNNEETI